MIVIRADKLVRTTLCITDGAKNSIAFVKYCYLLLFLDLGSWRNEAKKLRIGESYDELSVIVSNAQY